VGNKYRYIVQTNPKPGMEDEYNDWYSNQHIQDVTRIPGFVAAQRFQWVPKNPSEEAPRYRYLAIYDIETDDMASAFAGLSAAAGTAAMPISPALGEANAVVFEAMTPRVSST
jgi:hypothetical protein